MSLTLLRLSLAQFIADFEALLSCSENDNFSKERLRILVSVESVDRCIKKLKLGKALGPDGLNAEHLMLTL